MVWRPTPNGTTAGSNPVISSRGRPFLERVVPKTMTQLIPNLQRWYRMRKKFDKIVLRAGDDSYVKGLKNRYYPRPIKDEIKRDTIFWYEPGRYGSKEGHMEMAGILLKDLIPEYVQRATYDALHGMEIAQAKCDSACS
jgi:hypothetical protein